MFQRGHEIIPNGLGYGNMDGRRNHIIAGLSHIDVIVGMDGVFRTDRLTGQLAGTIRNDLVRVHVRTRTRASLEDIDREMLIQLAFDHFLRCLNDESRSLLIELSKVSIRLCGSPLDKSERTNQGPAQPISANWKVENGPLRTSTVECVGWHFHRAHGILFDSSLHMKKIWRAFLIIDLLTSSKLKAHSWETR
jgi:hypothetical protein